MSNNNEGSNACDSLDASIIRSSMGTLLRNSVSMLEMNQIAALNKCAKYEEDDRDQYCGNEHKYVENNIYIDSDMDSKDYYFLDLENEIEIPLVDVHTSSITVEVSPAKENRLHHAKERTDSFIRNNAQLEANVTIRRVKSQSILKTSSTYDETPRDLISRATSFGTLEIREYPITLGDNPGGIQGPPVSLDWRYDKEQTQVIPLEAYENARSPRRNREQMRMAENMRRWRLLKECRFTMKDLDKASKTAHTVRRQREKSLRYDSALSKIRKKVGKILNNRANLVIG